MTTVIEAIQDIATKNSSTREDEAVVNYMLRRLNIDGKVVSGIVYIAPYNTAPTDIHTFCKTLIKTFKDQGLI